MSGELTTVQDPQNWATVQSLQTAAPLVICNNIPCVYAPITDTIRQVLNLTTQFLWPGLHTFD